MNKREQYEADAIAEGAWQLYLAACKESKQVPVLRWADVGDIGREYWIEQFKKSQVQLHTDDIKEAWDFMVKPIEEPTVFAGLYVHEPLALATQVDGDHYKSMAIQPVEFNHANNMPFIEGSVIKYICRHRNKNGLKDLEKAKHFIDLLIQLEYTDTDLETDDDHQE